MKSFSLSDWDEGHFSNRFTMALELVWIILWNPRTDNQENTAAIVSCYCNKLLNLPADQKRQTENIDILRKSL